MIYYLFTIRNLCVAKTKIIRIEKSGKGKQTSYTFRKIIIKDKSLSAPCRSENQAEYLN